MLLYILDLSAILCALVCVRLVHVWRRRRTSHPFPPGPKGLPLIGNILDMPEAEVWEAAHQWGEKYGPLVHVRNLGTSYIFVNSYEIAVELFDRRGNAYSSRPQNTMLDLEGWDWFVALMPYGDELRRSRQLLHRFLQPTAVEDYKSLQTQSTYKLLEGMLDDPEAFPERLRHSIGATIIMIAYGHQASEKNDPYIDLAEQGLEAVTEAQEFFLVNAFPLLQYIPAWFPGASFKRIASKGYDLSMGMYREPYKMAKAKLSEGNTAPSVISKLLDAKSAGDPVINDEALIAKAAGIMYGAAADTTVSSLHSFFLAMLLYPDVQRRAQDELDRVIGKDNLPAFEDRPNLPYIEAIVKETMRWQPVAPLAVAHTVDEDDEYNGYLIPKGATILPNIWAMLRDPKEYPRPDEFVPERWLPEEGKQPPRNVQSMFFGFGRRICPGRHFAENTIFINVASILAAFSISKAVHENGTPITPKVEYTTHFVRHPKPFKYVLTPRSDKIKTVVRQAVDTAVYSMF